jgi:hypothetical protein
MVTRLPTFLRIGQGKSGSSWLHETRALHPEVYLSEAKDLYFFGRYYDRGLDWYRTQFRSTRPGHRVVSQVCPDYVSCAEAPRRIRWCLGPDVRPMVTLREPTERAFSTAWQRIGRLVLTPELLGARQPASDARRLPPATFAQCAAHLVRRHNGVGVVGRVKWSALVQRVRYEPLGGSRPVLPPADATLIRAQLAVEVAGVERRFGIPLRQLWNWPGEQDHG